MTASKLAAGLVSGLVAGAGLLTALTATPTLAATPGGGCTATARIDSQWGAGQIVTVTVTNTSATTATGWTVTGTLGAGQKIQSAWNAVVSTAGSAVTATNTSWNGRLATGASTSFGMQLAGVAAAPVLSCDNGGAPAADVTVAEADNTRTVTLRVGQTLAVSLRADYRPTVAGGSALTQLSSSGGYPTGRQLSAVYRAAAAGTADVTSSTPSGVIWAVHVSVIGTSPTGSGQTYIVTTADNQHSLGLVTGDILVVSLPSNYVPPAVTPAGVLSLSSVSGGYPATEPLVARYLAVAPGQADVASYTDAACNHQPMPCPSPSVPWLLHVTVG